MNVRVVPDAEQLAQEASAFVAQQACRAIDERRRFCLALSGGRSPQRMFAALARERVPWDRVHLFQVDERAAPVDSPARNWGAIRSYLLDRVAIPETRVHPMSAASADLAAAADDYAATLREVLGPDMTLDLVHLGLGDDGHTASLLPGDPALESDDDVIVAREYQGYRRLSLSLPVIRRAREQLWFVAGTAKRDMLSRVVAGDRSIPAGRAARDDAVLFADGDAAALL